MRRTTSAPGRASGRRTPRPWVAPSQHQGRVAAAAQVARWHLQPEPPIAAVPASAAAYLLMKLPPSAEMTTETVSDCPPESLYRHVAAVFEVSTHSTDFTVTPGR